MSDGKKGGRAIRGDYREIIVIAAKLMVITLFVAGLLSLINEFTKDRIAAAAEQEQKAALEKLIPGADFAELNLSDYSGIDKSIEKIFEAKKDGATEGYAVIASPNGFGGAVRLLVGINAKDLKITSVLRLGDSETPGIGSKALVQKYLDKYAGQTGVIEFSKNAGTGVQAIAGATITSEAVRKGVNAALAAAKAVKGGGSNG